MDSIVGSLINTAIYDLRGRRNITIISNICNAAGDRDRFNHVAIDQAISGFTDRTGAGIGVFRQSNTVVYLCRICGSDRQRLRCDFKQTGIVGNDIVALDITRICLCILTGRSRGDDIFAVIRENVLTGFACQRIKNRITRDKTIRNCSCELRIIGSVNLFIRVRCNNNRSRCNRQLTVLIFNFISI